MNDFYVKVGFLFVSEFTINFETVERIVLSKNLDDAVKLDPFEAMLISLTIGEETALIVTIDTKVVMTEYEFDDISMNGLNLPNSVNLKPKQEREYR